MADRAPESTDPDVLALTASVRVLTSRAHSLARGIQGTLVELKEFRDDLAEMRARAAGVRDD